jgi:hypothetical protein
LSCLLDCRLLSWITWTIFVVYFAVRLFLMCGGATWFGTSIAVQISTAEQGRAYQMTSDA